MPASAMDDLEPVTRVAEAHPQDGVSREPRTWLGMALDGRWRLVRLLGVGGTSSVYEGIDAQGRRAALKVLSRCWMAPACLLNQVRYEASLSRAVDHPGMVEVLEETLSADGSVFMAMELLDGETLEQTRQAAGGKLSPARVLPIMDALLDIVAATHDRGIVHHDLKPGNVFVTSSGSVKLIDFGLARTKDEPSAPEVWFGTPGFVPPEQARGELRGIDGRTDVWALGATLFVTLSGQSVHLAPTPEEEVALAGYEPARSLAEAAPWLPRAIVEVVDRALELDPADRWPDVRAMRAALRGPARQTVPAPGPAESGVHRIPDRAPLGAVAGVGARRMAGW